MYNIDLIEILGPKLVSPHKIAVTDSKNGFKLRLMAKSGFTVISAAEYYVSGLKTNDFSGFYGR